MGKYTDYIMKTAQDLLSVPSPSGFTHMAADFVKKEFEKEKSHIKQVVSCMLFKQTC